ncbi:MAG TPA: hypothetical protein VGO93_23725 [Candidatus Xenobia bacterium]
MNVLNGAPRTSSAPQGDMVTVRGAARQVLKVHAGQGAPALDE